MSAVQNWSQAVQTSFASAFAVLLAGIPKIIGFLLILIIGWIVASIIAGIVDRLLKAVHFNDLAGRSGIGTFVRDMGMTSTPADVLAGIVKWFIRLIVLVAAFDALGLPAVSTVLQRFLLWIPNLVVALVVLVVGGLVANALSRIVRGAAAEAGLGSPDLLATMTRWAILAFAILIAIDQIGIASTFANTLFIGLVGAVALAVGLAFGLGGRETAGQIVQQWYTKGQNTAPQLAQAASRQAQQVSSDTQQATGTGSAATPANRQRPSQ